VLTQRSSSDEPQATPPKTDETVKRNTMFHRSGICKQH
jgi:hypothetical protein